MHVRTLGGHKILCMKYQSKIYYTSLYQQHYMTSMSSSHVNSKTPDVQHIQNIQRSVFCVAKPAEGVHATHL